MQKPSAGCRSPRSNRLFRELLHRYCHESQHTSECPVRAIMAQEGVQPKTRGHQERWPVVLGGPGSEGQGVIALACHCEQKLVEGKEFYCKREVAAVPQDGHLKDLGEADIGDGVIPLGE